MFEKIDLVKYQNPTYQNIKIRDTQPRENIDSKIQILKSTSINPAFYENKETHSSLFHSIENKRRQYIDSDSRVIHEFCKDPLIPEPLRNLIEAYTQTTYALYKQENLSFPQTISPTTSLLEKIADYYFDKYGIQIKVLNTDQLAEKLNDINFLEQDEPIGIIVLQEGEYSEGHVTPILCDFTKTEKSVVILDVLGNKGDDPYGTIVELCSEKNIQLKSTANIRQADKASCRTEATGVLRNALLDIKLKKRQGESTNFESLTKPISLEEEEFQDERIQYVKIPPEWDYIDQFTSEALKQENKLSAIAIRDVFSSKSEKQKNPRSAIEFRRQHTNTVKFKNSLVLNKEDIVDIQNLSKVLELAQEQALPSFISVEESDKDITVSWEELKEVNTYLAVKGFQNVNSQIERNKYV